ncbi:MAG: fibronectin type III domain-containing protein, partial [Candidatus Neomarinimicrobiota bacterium]
MNTRLLKHRLLAIFLFAAFMPNTATSQIPGDTGLPGFTVSSYFAEQVVTFKLRPDLRIHINIPAAAEFDDSKPVALALFALPNGNTIEQTAGKVIATGDDWHYDIQHIGAQTRFLRHQPLDYNLVTIYLETTQMSWPAWKALQPNYASIIKTTVEYLLSCFRDYDPFVILTGHSGGGRFIFSFLDAFDTIPTYVKRICFLDSNYGYEHSYGDQIIAWLQAASDNFVSVLAYNDSIALYNGAPVVSATGGTWYRSRIMQKYLAGHFSFATAEDTDFIRHTALDGRIKILLKKNPDQAILHTVQVERNGFIHTLLTGTAREDNGYEYYGNRAYSDLIQPDEIIPRNFQIPLRSPDSPTGSAFMESVRNLSFADREEAILNQLYSGNMPYFLRDLQQLEQTFNDANGTARLISYRVMPDYLAVGSDDDFCRVPMGPITAQKVADFYGACLPTAKLVDNIYVNATIKLAPVTYVPVDNQNETVEKFIEHNTAINNQFAAVGGFPGQLTGGTKKDVVLSNKIIDPTRPDHVVIYGWHQLNGLPIQPLTNIHTAIYVDYSHGIRFLDAEISIDGVTNSIQTVLKDPILYKLLSKETGSMSQPTYITDTSIPARPKSFGVRSESDRNLRIVIAPDATVDRYRLYRSSDGIVFTTPIIFQGSEFLLEDLPPDTLVYIKLIAENSAGLSTESEVLAGLPVAVAQPEMLIVNGFDRASTGNTCNFIRQHAAALAAGGATFDAATNDAVTGGLFDLQ